MSWIKEHLHDDVNKLALEATRYPDVDMREALVQIRGWQIAEKKLPLWAQTEGVLYPDHLPLEQCSSQVTAEYKASIISSMPVKDTMTDLTGGFGVDAAIIGRQFARLTFVEQNPELCDLARHNLPLLGVRQLEVVNGNCQEYIRTLPHQNLILIDPARRDKNGRRTFAISDCTPDVCQLTPHMLRLADKVMVKLSPMLDITSVINSLQGLSELHIVSVHNECKELLAIHDPTATDTIPRVICVNLTSQLQAGWEASSFDFTTPAELSLSCSYTSAVQQYLYEPNASIMKGGCFCTVSHAYGIRQLHPNSHLFTSDDYMADFPGRAFRVEAVKTLSKCDIRELHDLKKANITLRNFPGSVADLRKRLHLSDGGDTYLFATTLADNRRVIIVCRK